MNQKKYPLKIWLKNKQEPLNFLLTAEQIMDFTDWANGNVTEKMSKSLFIFDFGGGKFFMIFKNALQAFEMNLNEGETA